eukprot:ctg_28.g31
MGRRAAAAVVLAPGHQRNDNPDTAHEDFRQLLDGVAPRGDRCAGRLEGAPAECHASVGAVVDGGVGRAVFASAGVASAFGTATGHHLNISGAATARVVEAVGRVPGGLRGDIGRAGAGAVLQSGSRHPGEAAHRAVRAGERPAIAST